MNKKGRLSQLISVFGGTVIAALLSVWLITGRAADQPGGDGALPVRQRRDEAKQMAHLYFADANGRYLVAEQKIMPDPMAPAALVRRLVESLIQGPQRTGNRTLPRDAELRAAYVLEDGMAVVDFTMDAFTTHPGGVETELLSIYSIVNTLIVNVETIRSVKFLIGGQESATLAGHVDLSRPFTADMLWVR